MLLKAFTRRLPGSWDAPARWSSGTGRRARRSAVALGVVVRGVDDDLAAEQARPAPGDALERDGEDDEVGRRAASCVVAARACGPSSSTRSWRVSGPRLLLSTTSCPASTASRATVLPMCPLPMSPMVVMASRTAGVGRSFRRRVPTRAGRCRAGPRPVRSWAAGTVSGGGSVGPRAVLVAAGGGRTAGSDQDLDRGEEHARRRRPTRTGVRRRRSYPTAARSRRAHRPRSAARRRSPRSIDRHRTPRCRRGRPRPSPRPEAIVVRAATPVLVRPANQPTTIRIRPSQSITRWPRSR